MRVLRTKMMKMKNLQLKGPSTKYDYFMRVSMDKNEENEKYCLLKKTIITLIEHVQVLLWRSLVVEIFHFLHFCSYKLS